MDLQVLRVISIIAIALVYMLFDIFNRRNVPGVFVYATLAYGFLLSILYLNMLAVESIAIGMIVLGGGYMLYKAGQLGAADVAEFATISLILPIQPIPWFVSINQLGLPFILSLLIGSGVTAIIIVPIYYLVLGGRNTKVKTNKKSIFKALIIFLAYAVFILFAKMFVGLNIAGLLLLLVLAVFSSIMLLYEDQIAIKMVRYVGIRDFEEGDIIATNMMSKKMLESVRKRVKRFDRLVTSSLLNELKSKRIRGRFPVYKNAMPMALPIFIGLLLSLAFGDIILLVFPVL
ncbi:MAG: hypothetical protein ACP5SA_02235 [Candidatus Micrarchaeia archaeon]